MTICCLLPTWAQGARFEEARLVKRTLQATAMQKIFMIFAGCQDATNGRFQSWKRSQKWAGGHDARTVVICCCCPCDCDFILLLYFSTMSLFGRTLSSLSKRQLLWKVWLLLLWRSSCWSKAQMTLQISWSFSLTKVSDICLTLFVKEASPWNSWISRLKAKLGVTNVAGPANAHDCLYARILKTFG